MFVEQSPIVVKTISRDVLTNKLSGETTYGVTDSNLQPSQRVDDAVLTAKRIIEADPQLVAWVEREDQPAT